MGTSTAGDVTTLMGLSFLTITLLAFGLNILIGIITAIVATRNERSGFLAFFAGLFLGVLGLMTYMIMGESMELRLRMLRNSMEPGAFGEE